MKTMLKNKIILVTGAGSGIGAATAKKCLDEGAQVILHYNSAPNEAGKLAKKYGPERTLTLQANLINPTARDQLFSDAMSWRGKIDGLVNNAGLMSEATIDQPIEKWRHLWRDTMAVNIEATADLCYHAVRHFQAKGTGHIVNVASRAAFRGDMPNSMHYAASKGAVVAFTRSLAKGFAAENIYAFIVAPGWVMTERVRPTLEHPDNAFMTKEIPMQKPAPPEEIANMIAFLLSGQVNHATGSTFDINGASYFH